MKKSIGKFAAKKQVIAGITAFTLTAMTVTGCGKNNASPEPNTGSADSNAASENVSASEPASDAKKDTTAGDSKQQGALVSVITHKLSCEAEGKVHATGSYPEMVLSDEFAKSYPKLKEAIANENSKWESGTTQLANDYALYHVQDNMYPDTEYVIEYTVEIVRADDRIFTIMQNYYDFSGGVHPNHGTNSINIDPATGKYIELQDTVINVESAAETIKNCLYETYPDMVEELDSFIFFSEEDGGALGEYTAKLKEDGFTWALLPEGLKIHFSPYEVASYAAGDLEILLPYDKYPDLIQQTFIPQESFDSNALVATSEAETVKIEIEVPPTPVSVANKSWYAFTEDGRGPDDGVHIKLSKISEDKTDWLDTEKWAAQNGFAYAKLPYSDGTYYYYGADAIQYDYMYNELQIYDSDGSNLLYDLDLYELCNGPDEEQLEYSAVTQFIKWAQIYDGTLYVSVGHNGYASEEPMSSYMLAIAPDTGYVLWRSEPLVSNAGNFKIVEDSIICGYGFTAEDDFVYLLDRFTGKKMDKIKVNSGPYQFEVVDDTLYLATYNTDYRFKIEK